MSQINPKNLALSPAGTALGLGDSLNSLLDDQEEERKKRMALGMGGQMSNSPSMLGGAVSSLLGMGAVNGG